MDKAWIVYENDINLKTKIKPLQALFTTGLFSPGVNIKTSLEPALERNKSYIFLSIEKNISLSMNMIKKILFSIILVQVVTSIAFEANCQSPGNGLYGNNFVSGKYGLRFINNAIIGQQSWSTTSTQSSKNVWGAAGNFTVVPGGRQTYIENTLPVANPNVVSKLFLNNIPTSNGNPSTIPVPFPYVNGTGLISAFIVSDECAVPPPIPAAAPVAAMSSAIQPAVNNTGITDNNAKMLNKQTAYNLIEDMPSLKTVSSLNTFYNANTTSCVGKLRQVQDKIRQGNFAAAKTINNSFTPTCNAEIHTKNYFDLYMKWKTDTLCCDSLFRNDVLTIANACPETHGIVVNKAQALYNLITKQNNVFTSNCGTAAGSRILNTNANNNNDESKAVILNAITESISIAPNPNNGQFTIQFANTNNEKINIIIRDASQKLLFDSKVEVKERQIKLDLGYLKSGVYFAYINDNNDTQKVLKFVVANNE
jgi:Secretion system C-terminal sorting domain